MEASAFIRISRIFTSESVFLLKVHTRSSRTCIHWVYILNNFFSWVSLSNFTCSIT